MKKKVMVVDDDKAILISVREILEQKGYEVVTVKNGKECLDNLHDGFTGVILMDIMMPEMDGWDTIREIVKDGFSNKNLIAVLTAKETPDNKMNGLQEYIIDYITKPFDPDVLIQSIENYFTILPNFE